MVTERNRKEYLNFQYFLLYGSLKYQKIVSIKFAFYSEFFIGKYWG